MNTETDLRAILARCRVIAVVGLSPNANRPSHEVASYMQAQGYRIVPVNPLVAAQGDTLLGETCYASLSEAAGALAQQGARIDLVDCFRRSEDIPPIVHEAIAIGADTVWMQLGVMHDGAAARARSAGLAVVQNLCLLVEHARLLGRRH